MQLTSTMFLPLLVSTEDARYGSDHLLEDFTEDLDVGYSFGPPYGNRLVTWDDLDELEIGQGELRQVAVDNLYRLLPRLRIDGQPPAPMLSFGGLESTVLLAAEVWQDLEQSVPGELVVGVPARDVVIVTGTASRPGMEKVRRAVDRIFFAGDENLLSRELLVWRQGGWSAYRTAPASEPRPHRQDGSGPEPDRRRGRTPEPDQYRVPQQRSGNGGTTDWPERPPVRRPRGRRPRPNG